MKCIIAYSLILAVSLVAALPLENKNLEKYVLLPIRYERNDGFLPYTNSSFGERDVKSISLENRQNTYRTTLMVGTPGQPQNMDINIGCSDSWVYAEHVPWVTQTYDPAKSSTNHYTDLYFDSGSRWERIIGSWMSDTVTIGDSTLENQPLGLVTSISEKRPWLPFNAYKQDVGVLCLGFEHGEQSSYPESSVSILRNLRDQGHIAREVYSLFLDEASSAKSGSLLFGAIDSKKYTGPLKTVELTTPHAFRVKVPDLFVGDKRAPASFEAFLDCNTVFTFLPYSTVRAIADFYNARWDMAARTFAVKDLPSFPLIFDFGGVTIAVDPAEIFSKQFGSGENYGLIVYSNIHSGGENFLGSSFLRSAYVVFDLERHQISFAQSSFNSAESNIIPIVGDIPGAI